MWYEVGRHTHTQSIGLSHGTVRRVVGCLPQFECRVHGCVVDGTGNNSGGYQELRAAVSWDLVTKTVDKNIEIDVAAVIAHAEPPQGWVLSGLLIQLW